VRFAVEHDERAIRQVVERRVVVALPPRLRIDALLVQLRVDRVGARLPRVQRLPRLYEAVVVRAPAESAGPVSG
jgi:hypothetical protein